MKKILIKFLIILVASMLINTIIFNTNSYASSLGDPITKGDEFIEKANDTDEVIDTEELGTISDYIYNTLFTIGVVLAFAIGMIIGIQFIMGSVEEKAKIKETLVPYVIGVFVIFSAFTIWKIVVGIGNEVAPTASVQTIQQNDYKCAYKV